MQDANVVRIYKITADGDRDYDGNDADDVNDGDRWL